MPNNLNQSKVENFERAFSEGTVGCRRACECGREFFDGVNSYDWEEGELESLEASPKATRLDYSVGTVRFEGREYCIDCDCWKNRAKQLIYFIDSHAHRIAKYLTLEKQRKQDEADNSAIVQ